jgi:hypothetical protein
MAFGGDVAGARRGGIPLLENLEQVERKRQIQLDVVGEVPQRLAQQTVDLLSKPCRMGDLPRGEKGRVG